jgi:RNA polymerase sigma-70 factor (ECF subfamily)
MKHELSPPEQWLTLHGDILYRFGLARIGEPEIAEDLVQETLLAALKAKNNFTGKSSEQTWLIGILKHKVIDYFRKKSRDTVQEFDEELVSEDDYFNQQGHWQEHLSLWSKPEKLMEQEQFILVLQQCISKLPKRMAQLFMLTEFDNMTTKQVCELMSISTMNNFWVMQSRVRMQLRHCLDINWNGQ